VLVASIWSAYFYLFAIAGVAILVGHAVLGLAMIDRQREGVIEAYAFRVLAPHDPDAWRKWAAAQLAVKQYAPALRSLERYVSLAGEKGRADAEVQAVIQSLQRVVHGDIAHAALRNAGPNANSSP
jgi:hypothetical protein